jgi:hypothetical protein
MKKRHLLFVLFAIVSTSLFAQETYSPTETITGTFIGKTAPLRDFPVMTEIFDDTDDMIVVPHHANVSFEENTTTSETIIPNLQTEPGSIVAMPIEQNFIGASQNESGFLPPDPTGAVGPNHYVHSVNSLVKIFSKTGTLLVGPVNLSTFLGIPSNNGDPIVMYDQLADRWFVSEFGALGADLGLAIGVSETNDPTGAYNVWQFDMGAFPDYPHYGIWHDGYYGTANYAGLNKTAAFVMERDAMLDGAASPKFVLFDLPGVVSNPLGVKSAEPANLLGTDYDPESPGYITYQQDDGWAAAITYDHLKIWEINMDWNVVGNSTISDPLEIPTDAFDAGEIFGDGNGAIRQPNTSRRLAGHGGIISFAANYRQFDTHNSWLITFNTFIDAAETGGIRWIELRNDDSNPWEIYQEGTYSIADGHSRVMSSAAIDAEGNIAMAYTTASVNLPVSLRYTGRFDGDPLGTMTVAETIIINGPGVRTNTNRYGDYSHMTMDPDNFTFWYTGDYFASNNFWRTQIASFRIFGPFANDVGVVAITSPEDGVLSGSETVEVSIRNFSPDPITNVPVELRVDGSLVASETFSGTINSNEIVTYQFSQSVNLSTAGQTYAIDARTTLGGDGYNPNNGFTKDVMHLLNNDVGVSFIISPQTASDLGAETVTIKVKNYGAQTQSNFNVQYSLDGDTPVTQSFTGSVAFDEESNFSFSQTVDLSDVGSYSLTAKTLLSGDQFPANDEVSVVVENLLCQPTSNCTVGHGFTLFEVGGINNASGCGEDGYSDFTSQIANLSQGSTNTLTISSDYGNQYMSVWIDFNDDMIFTANEALVDNYLFAAGEGSGSYTETIDLVIPGDAAVGEHVMRARANGTGTITNDDACEEISFGETEDYTANIGTFGVADNQISNSELIVTTLPNDRFEVILNTDYTDGVFLAIYNVLGQDVGFTKRVPRIENAYKMNIDMSSMSSGVYLIRVGGQGPPTMKTARIMVK